MRRPVSLTPQAEDELESQFAYYYLESGEGLAEDFHAAFSKTRDLLAEQPDVGSARPWLEGDLRVIRVSRPFRNIVVIDRYRPSEREVLILHVVHGSRNLIDVL